MRKKRGRKAPEDLWFGAEGEEEGKPLIFRGRQHVPSGIAESAYPTRVSIYWHYEPANDSGMPDEETNDAHSELENALDRLDSPEFSYLMLIVTGNGRKEWHWYVSGVEAWKNKLNELLENHPVFPILIEKNDEADWALYHDFMSGLDGI